MTEKTVKLSVYESAVRGRREFRTMYRVEKQYGDALEAAVRAFLEPYKELSDEQLIGVINGADESCCTLAPHIAAHVRAFRKIIQQAGETK